MKPSALVADYLPKIELQLQDILTLPTPATNLAQAMQYSCLGGGKRIRPLLTIAAGNACDNSNTTSLIKVGCAIELIHCYSLIHDDLPAMDNDDLRRGQATCHKKFGEALAILAGDAIQTMAFEVLSSTDLDLPATAKIALIHLCARSSGLNGMAGGQALDIYNTDKQLTLDELSAMHMLKTGRLIEAAILSGCISSGITHGEVYNSLSQIAIKVGLLFQVIDDIIDVTCTTSQLGKTANKDAHNNKATYVTLLGIKDAIDYAQTLHSDIIRQAKQLTNRELLVYLVDLIYNRQK